MPKEYEFICSECHGLFTTKDKENPLCRPCTQKVWKAHLDKSYSEMVRFLVLQYGRPIPSAKQAHKWNVAREMKSLIEERDQKINKGTNIL